jgi:hypothetical protein
MFVKKYTRNVKSTGESRTVYKLCESYRSERGVFGMSISKKEALSISQIKILSEEKLYMSLNWFKFVRFKFSNHLSRMR